MWDRVSFPWLRSLHLDKEDQDPGQEQQLERGLPKSGFVLRVPMDGAALAETLPSPTYLIEHHLPVLGMPRGQENLLALLVNLIHAGS